jgi:hypothetical protein
VPAKFQEYAHQDDNGNGYVYGQVPLKRKSPDICPPEAKWDIEQNDEYRNNENYQAGLHASKVVLSDGRSKCRDLHHPIISFSAEADQNTVHRFLCLFYRL